MENKKGLRIKPYVLSIISFAFLIFSVLIISGCARPQTDSGNNELKGQIDIDGSSTVYLVTAAVAEDFQAQNPDVKINVGISGTGGGMKKFVAGEIDICDASREIKEEEIEAAKKNGIEVVEFKIGFDGITVVVNKANNWCNDLTLEELKKIWEPNSKVKKWSDVRPGWPDEKIYLLGPDTDSGTFEFFTEHVVGEKKASRTDYVQSSDDNVLVEGVAGEKYSLGYFGYAYYSENKDRVKAIKVNGVEPGYETILSSKYPIIRHLYLYVKKDALSRPEVKAFLKYYLEVAKDIVPEVGYVPLPDEEYTKLLEKL